MYLVRLGLALALGAAASPAQSFSHDIALTGLGNGNPAAPFGITYEPFSNRLYVGVSGTPAANNDVVAVIDAATDAVLGTIPAGAFPADVAFVYDAAGVPRYGAVTNSTSGSVTIWDANHQIVATVALPDPLGFGTCFPFGITAAADQSRFYVSTQDGHGDVYAIDVATLQYDPAASILLAAKLGGRLRHRNDTLYLPWGEFDPLFSGARGGLSGWNIGGLPFFWDRLAIDRSGQFVYPSGNDLEFLPDGRYLLGGNSFDHRLYLFQGNGELLRTIRIHTGTGSAHGLALDPGGTLLAACDLAANEVALVDLLNFVELSRIHLRTVGAGYLQPNEAVLVHDKLYVTCQGSEHVVVFDNLPDPAPGAGYAGTITVSETTPPPGVFVDVAVSGPGTVLLLRSADDQRTSIHGTTLDIGPNPSLAGAGNGGFAGRFRVPHSAPAGLHHFFQGVVDAAGTRRLTEPRAIVVQ